MQKTAPKNYKRLYTRIIIGVVSTLVVLGLLFLLFAFQVPQYSFHYTKCGFKQPVKVVGRGFGSSMLNYVVPTDSGYMDEVFTVQGYFCTELEAQQAGLKAMYKDGELNSESTPALRVKW